MPQLTGFKGLNRVLNRLKKRASESNVSVQVGYTQVYAVYVHEDLEAHHPVGQAKYLEAPARSLQGDLARITSEVYQKTGSMAKALTFAGLRLQRESQMLVPVDTSALKASAYTALDKNADAAASAALQKSEQIRLSALKKRKTASKKSKAIKKG